MLCFWNRTNSFWYWAFCIIIKGHLGNPKFGNIFIVPNQEVHLIFKSKRISVVGFFIRGVLNIIKGQLWNPTFGNIFMGYNRKFNSPPARWGLLDFIRTHPPSSPPPRQVSRQSSSPSSDRSTSAILVTNLKSLSPILVASSGSQSALLDLICQGPIALCTAGPHRPGSDRSVHRWTSSASSGSQCAPLEIALCTAGPDPPGSNRRVHRWTSTEYMSDSMPAYMSDHERMPDRMLEYMPE